MELEKNSEEKQQLESQIQSLKDRIQAFPTSHALPVSNRCLSLSGAPVCACVASLFFNSVWIWCVLSDEEKEDDDERR